MKMAEAARFRIRSLSLLTVGSDQTGDAPEPMPWCRWNRSIWRWRRLRRARVGGRWCRPLKRTRFVPLPPFWHCRAGLSHDAASRLSTGTAANTAPGALRDVSGWNLLGAKAVCYSSCQSGDEQNASQLGKAVPKLLPRFIFFRDFLVLLGAGFRAADCARRPEGDQGSNRIQCLPRRA